MPVALERAPRDTPQLSQRLRSGDTFTLKVCLKFPLLIIQVRDLSSGEFPSLKFRGLPVPSAFPPIVHGVGVFKKGIIVGTRSEGKRVQEFGSLMSKTAELEG